VCTSMGGRTPLNGGPTPGSPGDPVEAATAESRWHLFGAMASSHPAPRYSPYQIVGSDGVFNRQAHVGRRDHWGETALVSDTAHFRFIVTFRDRSREPDVAIRSRRIGMLCEKSAPRKVTKSHIIERDTGNRLIFGWFPSRSVYATHRDTHRKT
jgi:hypothetical protein